MTALQENEIESGKSSEELKIKGKPELPGTTEGRESSLKPSGSLQGMAKANTALFGVK